MSTLQTLQSTFGNRPNCFSVYLGQYCGAADRGGWKAWTDYGNLALLLRSELLSCILRETPLDHLFDLESLNSEKIENHIVSQSELGC